MGEPFLGEVRIVSFNFPPRGWALCNGQLLPINQNTALFSILGTTYGGDGRVNFALPNLQGRVPFHAGAGLTLGQSADEARHTLTVSELPAHTHTAAANSADAGRVDPNGNFWAKGAASAYRPSANSAMNSGSLLNTGGSQTHENMAPFTVLTFVIALQGIFPSRN